INTVTKSGSNLYQANAYTYFTNQNLRGNVIGGIDLGSRDNEYDWVFGATTSGAIVKDKLFYFLNYEQENKPLQVIPYRACLDGETPGGMISRTRLSDMQKVSDFVKKEYGYDPGSATDFPGDNHNRKILARLDWNINSTHRLMVRYNYAFDRTWNAPNENSSDTGYRLYNTKRVGPQSMVFSNNMYSYNSEVHSAAVELNSRFSDLISNHLLATYTNNREYRGSNSALFPHVDIMYEGKMEPYMSLGYELFSGYTDLTTRVANIKDDFSLFLGEHRIMAGLSYEYQWVSNLYMRNALMYYRYKSVDDFINKARPESFALTYGYDNVERPADRTSFHQLSFYVQDEWNVSPDFKLTYGIRLDELIFDQSGFQRNNATYALNFLDGKKIDTGLAPKPYPSVSPRIGFSYNVLGDGSLTLRGGTGLFLGHLPLVYFLNMPSTTNINKNAVQYKTTYTAGVASSYAPQLDDFVGRGMITKVPDLIKHFNLPTQLSPDHHISPSSIVGLDPETRLPQMWKTTLAVDYKLPTSFPMKITAEGIFNKTVVGCYIQNINVAVDDNWPRFTGADNRLIYPAGAGEINSGKKVGYLTNTNEGYGVNAHLSLNMTPVKNLDITAAYAYIEAREMTGFPATDLYSSLTNLPSVDGPNRPRLQRTQFASPHRVTASVNYFVPWNVFNGKGLNINLFYTAFSPYGYSYIYSNDMNGDSIANDLMYIPADDSEIVFVDNAAGTADQHRQAFWAFVEQDAYLRSHKGQ
ncbi:MAG: TonB-dependent receptor, partial [Bacteroidales bacterium]|nr:TonB-dependent receptor [Bacteroidales bacterium]